MKKKVIRKRRDGVVQTYWVKQGSSRFNPDKLFEDYRGFWAYMMPSGFVQSTYTSDRNKAVKIIKERLRGYKNGN